MFRQAAKFLAEAVPSRPSVAVVLGSGLGGFADAVQTHHVLPYTDIPGWPRSTAVGHSGELVFGEISGIPAVVMAGRAHMYEGYSAARAAFGVRVLGLLGVKSLVLTNAAGGINFEYGRGALVTISDHINLLGSNPLSGANDEDLGPRFPDMTEAYSVRYREVAGTVADQLGIELKQGVYAAVPGPSYETPAEIRYLRTIGADLVGMSTVPEVIVANHMDIEVLAISCVTNMAAGILPQKIRHEEVLETGEMVRGTMLRLLAAVIPRLVALDPAGVPSS